jgi:hypothetical protein
MQKSRTVNILECRFLNQRSHLGGVTFAVIESKAPDPVGVSPLGAQAEVPQARGRSHAI